VDWFIGIPVGFILVVIGALCLARSIRWVSPAGGVPAYWVGILGGGLMCTLPVFVISVFSGPADVTRNTYGAAISALILALVMMALVVDVENLDINRRIETVTVALGTVILEAMALVADIGFAEAQLLVVILFVFMQFVHRNRKGAGSGYKDNPAPKPSVEPREVGYTAALCILGIALFTVGLYLMIEGGADLAHALFGNGGPLADDYGGSRASGSIADTIGPFGYALTAGLIMAFAAGIQVAAMRRVGQKSLAAGTLTGAVLFTCFFALLSVLLLDMTVYG
jgi:Ca2+/Na+ antiporter